MSINEFYEWCEYYSKDPFIADRLEIQLATICTMIGSFGKSKMKHSDFMVRKPEKQILSKDDYLKQLKTAFKGL